MNMAIRSLRFKVRLPRTGRRKAVTAREDLLEDTEILAAMGRDLERPPEMNAGEQDLLPWGGYFVKVSGFASAFRRDVANSSA